MPFQKGQKKQGGRKKGVLNKSKKSDQWDYFTNYCIKGGLIRFKKELDKLKGKQYVDAFLTLLEYHKPKLQRSELIGADKMKLQVEWVIPNKKELTEGDPHPQGVSSEDTPAEATGGKPEYEDIEIIGQPEENPPQAKPSEEAPRAIPGYPVPPGSNDKDIEGDNIPPIGLNI